MGIIDIVIILLILFGGLIGFKEGVIKKTTSFLGLFVVVIISFILKNHLMTPSEIKSQLQFNIRFIGKKNNMTNAVGDWEKDIDYVNEYIRSGKIHWKY